MASNSGTEHSWVARPWLARLIRIVAYLVPVTASLAFAFALSSWVPTPADPLDAVLRWLGIAVVSSVVLVAVERVTRRLLPLSTLFTLTLAFPDRVPSRFRIAIRIGTTAQLRRRLAEVERGDVGDTPGEVAERLLELVALLSKHDRMTRGHSERVRAYSHMLGRQMGLSGRELDRLRWAALLHDIGKLTVSADILNKPGRLTDAEFDEIKTHPMAGKKLVEPLAVWLGESVRAVWEHHERFDGGGYPQGLAGDDISLAARIVCVTDSFDVMTSTRSYKKPMRAQDARRELARCSGTQFDPTVVRAFLSISLGRLQSRTGPASWLGQLAMFPRAFAAQLGGSVAAGAAIGVGAVAGVAGLAAAGGVGQEITVPPALLPSSDEVPAGDGSGATPTAPGTDPDAPGAPGDADPPTDSSVPPVSLSPGSTPGLTPGGVVPGVTDPISTPGTLPGATVPGVTVPGGTVPTTVPVVTIPGPSLPGVTVPGVTVPPATLPGGTLPPVTLPGGTLPVVTVPPVTVTVPPVTVTVPPVTVTVPPVTVTVPGVTVPPVTVTVPPVTVTVPGVTVPPVTVTVPPVTVPPTTVPPVTVPPVTVPPTTVPPVTVPPTTVPPVTVPPVTVPPTTLPPVTVL